jgi:chromosome segregation ATPase
MAAVQRRDTAAARTPERTALAAAIERRDGLNVRLEEAYAKIAALTQRRFAALGKVNEGEESLVKARARAMDLAAGSLDEALKPLKAVRAAIADAQEVADLLEPVLLELRAEAESLEGDANFAERNIDDAVRAVVAAAPETEALARAFAAKVSELAEVRDAIWPLQSSVPKHLTPLLDMQPVHVVPRSEGVLAAAWNAALEALKADPDAALPG